MKSDLRAPLFSALALGLIGLCFLLLLNEAILSKQLWQELPRVFAGLIAPIPLALFAGFSITQRERAKLSEPSPRFMTIALVVTIGAVLGFGYLLKITGNLPSAESLGPVIAQSALFSSSVLNLLFLRSPLVASILSGLSAGLTIIVVFLT